MDKRTSLSSRKKLYFCGLSIIVLGIVDFIKSVANVIFNMYTGYFDTLISKFSPEYSDIAKGTFIFLYIFAFFIIFISILPAIQGIRISKNPCEKKGYIKAAKVLFVVYILLSLSSFKTLFSVSYRYLAESILNVVVLISQCVAYYMFIKSAKEVRNEFLSQNQNSKSSKKSSQSKYKKSK